MDELKKAPQVEELDEDELDMVAGGCGGGGKGHDKGKGKGHHSHGNGKGLGHEKKGCGGCDEEEAAPASTGFAYTCPFCGKTATYADAVEARAHVITCPKNPNACTV